ncbi:hypothetical protein DMH04_44090 [Kibdelosporangium aridum]|uniref:Uncharacterized protein n=1 Tax=Kibdelosporangium aridum TaxID=2030 RepID=A0A428YQN5_KIBAR|nr:hypothetical protein DMH04_44090 [Kibdelosporangium aridum]
MGHRRRGKATGGQERAERKSWYRFQQSAPTWMLNDFGIFEGTRHSERSAHAKQSSHPYRKSRTRPRAHILAIDSK